MENEDQNNAGTGGNEVTTVGVQNRDYDSMDLLQLQKLCTERGIKFKSKDLKSSLRTKLEDQDEIEDDPNYKKSEPTAAQAWEQWTLPSGAIAKYRKLKGKDVRHAQRIADGDQGILNFALLALAVTIDGRGVTVEELDEMDEDDIYSLMIRKANFTSGQKI